MLTHRQLLWGQFSSNTSTEGSLFRRRKYEPLIIERTIGIVLGPSTSLYRTFLEHCTLTNKALGTIWRDLSKPPQRRQGPDPRPLWLIVGTPLVLGPELAFRPAEDLSVVVLSFLSYFFFIIFIFLFLSHYLRSAISLPFFIGSLSYLASW